MDLGPCGIFFFSSYVGEKNESNQINQSIVWWRVSQTFVVDGSISVEISFSYHLVDLLVCQLLSEICHHVTQLGRADVTKR